MGKKNKPNSIRKFIRKEKARIRRDVLSIKEQDNLILELYKKINTITAKRVEDAKTLNSVKDKRKTKEKTRA
ncbi:MAG: hypothetical protein U9P88_02285 [Patescibacteria group bacterium]|nr:hypothetical protein [Patescibacteria group bacterium]